MAKIVGKIDLRLDSRLRHLVPFKVAQRLYEDARELTTRFVGMSHEDALKEVTSSFLRAEIEKARKSEKADLVRSLTSKINSL